MSDRGSDCERGGADGATGDAPADEEPVTLTSLPPELLRHVIDAVGAAPAHMRADGSMSIRMPLALTCRAMWHACVTGALVLRFGGMRLRTDESDPPNAVRHAWSTLIRAIGPAGVNVRGLVLDDCNIRHDELHTLLSAPARGALELLALRRCHSLGHSVDLSAAPAARTLRAMLLVGVVLRQDALLGFPSEDESPGPPAGPSADEARLEPTGAPAAPLYRPPPASSPPLGALSILALTDCCVGGARLLSLLPELTQLRALLLGGAMLVGDLGPHLAENSPNAVAPLACLTLIELTFQPAEVRAALLERAPPECHVLDLCAPGAARVREGVAALRACVLGTGLQSGVGAAAADAAVAAVAGCRLGGGRGRSALHHAAAEGDAEAAAALLELGAPLNLKDEKGYTPLLRAVWSGSAPVTEALLATGGCDLALCNHQLESPLYVAALRGHAECLALLCEAARRPADHDAADAPAWHDGFKWHDGYTPVHAAVISHSAQCVTLLVDAGFPPDARNRFLQTPLHLAARLGDASATALLIGARADVTKQDERRHTPLHVARACGHRHVADLLEAAAGRRAAVGEDDGGRPGGCADRGDYGGAEAESSGEAQPLDRAAGQPVPSASDRDASSAAPRSSRRGRRRRRQQPGAPASPASQ